MSPLADLTLAQVLAELPDTADGIADRMRALGIKGRKGGACECPLANYLKDRGLPDVAVARYYARAFKGGVTEAEMPPAASEFVYRFDHGVYLDLVEVDRD